MKKIVSILLIVLCVAGIGLFGFLIFRKSNIVSVAVVGDMQTLYFANETTDVNFNKSKLKVTYKDGTTKLLDLNKDLVSIKNFSTSVTNNGIMKITYKSETIDVKYSVIYNGLYYVKSIKSDKVDGNDIVSDSNTFEAGLDTYGNDKTTSLDMIYFYNDGICDYYSRENSSDPWYVDDGHCDKNFTYSIVGDTLKVHLGENGDYNMKASFSEKGELSLINEECEYYNSENKDFIKSKVTRKFSYYEMKSERIIKSVGVSYYTDSRPYVFEVNQTYDENDSKILLNVVYDNDNFLKNVYVRFNTSMLSNKQGFNTSIPNPVDGGVYRIDGFYKSKQFSIYYKVTP